MSQNLFLEVKKPEIKETKGTFFIQKLKSSYWGPFSGLKTQDLIKTSRIFSGVIFCRRSFWLKIILQILTCAPHPSWISFFVWKSFFFQLHETQYWWEYKKLFKTSKMKSVQSVGKIGFFVLLIWKSVKVLSCYYWCQIEEHI